MVEKKSFPKTSEKPKKSSPKPEAEKKVTVVKKAPARKRTKDAEAQAEVAAPRLQPVTTEAKPASKEKVKPANDDGKFYATGRRKTSAARVWMKLGSGRITVNGKLYTEYFARPVLQMLVTQPLEATQRRTQVDIFSTVKGGGLSGQAGAVRHGISRTLDQFDNSLHKVLRQGGYLTRDSRTVERKKYGRAKARRSFQFSKR